MRRRTQPLYATLALAGVLAAPAAAWAKDNVAAAREALKAGDLKTAQIELRNAVRADPQNAAIRYDLARVELQLADSAAAERDVRAAIERGLDPHRAMPLLGQAMLAQGHAADLLKEFQPQGKDGALDAEIMVIRGQAQLQQQQVAAAAEEYAKAEQMDPGSVAAWTADARLALTQGDLAKAEERIGHALEAQPKAMEPTVVKAAILQQKGDVAGALALLDGVIAEQPPALLARVERASILVGTGKFDLAKQDVDAVLKLTPGNVQALFLRATLLHEAHQDENAEALLQRLYPAFDAFPRGYLLLAAVQDRTGELQQAQDSAARYVARVPGDLAGYRLLGSLYLKGGRPDLALEPLNRAALRANAGPAIYDLLGQAYLGTGQPGAAAAAFQTALKQSPDNSGIAIQLARALAASGKPEEAIGVLRDAFARDPKSEAVQENLFATALATGDLDRAEATLADIRKIAGDTPTIRNLTAGLQLARLDAAGAVATLQKVVEERPELIAAQVNLARALSLDGRGKDAEAVLEKVLAAHPAEPAALGLLVPDYVRSNRRPQAVALLEKAHAASPRDAAIAMQLGALYLKGNEPQKALDLARASKPKNGRPAPQMMLLEADALIALKKPDDARDVLQALLSADPRAINVRRQLAALLVQQGDYEAARNLIKEGLSSTPRNYQFDLDYAMVDLKASGLDKALETAASLRQQDFSFQPLGALKGDIYMAAGKPEEAAKAYQEALSSAPSSMFVARLAGAYARSGKREQARAVLAEWVAKHPGDLGIMGELSEFDIESGRLKEAADELGTILAAQPRNPVALNNLAWVYQLQGDKRAEELARKAYLLAPTAQSADTLGWILTQQGDPAKGAELLRQAAGSSGDPRIAYHLAVALKDSGQKDDAVRLLTAVSKAEGSFDEKAQAEKLLSEITKGS